MKTLMSYAVNSILALTILAAISACGSEAPTQAQIGAASADLAGSNSKMSITNAEITAKDWAGQVKPKYGKMTWIAQSDTAINENCLNGDMLATVEFFPKKGEAFKAQCGTTARFTTCIPNDEFDGKPQKTWKDDALAGNCPSADLPAEMPKVKL